MARIKKVKARKNYKCQKCGAEIKIGDEYYNVSMKRRIGGITWRRCSKCYPRASETTSSETLSAAYSIQEGLRDFIDANPFDWKSAADELDNALSELENLDGELDEKISNLESAFQGGCPALDTLNEYKDSVEQWRSEMESAKDEIEEIMPSEGAVITDEESEKIRSCVEQAADASEF